MKKGMRLLAVSLALAMVITCVPVNAASSSVSYARSSWWTDFWGKLTGQSTASGSEEETSVESPELTLVEDDTTVENGDMLRASTYSLGDSNSTQTASTSDDGVSVYADSTTTLKYFPVTMYNYDKTIINNATHQVEVDGSLGNTWNGIYFNDGNPSAESYTYSTGGEVSYTSTTVDYSNNNDYNTYINIFY